MNQQSRLMVGLDVGSTTVKAIVVDRDTDQMLWSDYQRHETKQPEKVFEFLQRMESEAGINPSNTRIFMTGSGGGTLAELLEASDYSQPQPAEEREWIDSPSVDGELI